MKKTILFAVAATLLAFGPLIASSKTQSKSSKTAMTTSRSMNTTKTSTKSTMSKTQELRGTVDSISSDRLAITTKSGSKDTFVLQKSTKNAAKAKAGDLVTVWYRESNGRMMATKIAVNHAPSAMKTSKTKTSATYH